MALLLASLDLFRWQKKRKMKKSSIRTRDTQFLEPFLFREFRKKLSKKEKLEDLLLWILIWKLLRRKNKFIYEKKNKKTQVQAGAKF